jgi:hypothetical protein
VISPPNAQVQLIAQAAITAGPPAPATWPDPAGNRPTRAEGTRDGGPALRQAFDAFVGQTFYGTLLKSMRQTVGKPAYFHGGRAEEIFQGQLDQTLVEEVSQASAERLTGPMFELFMLSRA